MIVNSATEHHPRRRHHSSSMLSKIRGKPVTGRLILRQDDYSTVVDSTIPSINCLSEDLSDTCLSTAWPTSGGFLHPYSAYSHGSTASTSSFFSSSSEPSLTLSESSWTSYGSSSVASTHVNIQEVCPDPVVVRDDRTWYGYDGDSQYDYEDYEYADERKESQSRRYKKSTPLSPRPQYYIQDYQQARRASDAYEGNRRWDALTEVSSRRRYSASPRSEDVYSEHESSEGDYDHHQDYYQSSPRYPNTQLQRVPVSHKLNKANGNNNAVIPAAPPAPQGTIRVGGFVVHAGNPAKRNQPHPHQQQQLLLQQRSQDMVPARSQFFGWEDLCDASDLEEGISVSVYYDDGDDLDHNLHHDEEGLSEEYERSEGDRRELGRHRRRERYQQQQLPPPPPQQQQQLPPPPSPPQSQKRISAAVYHQQPRHQQQPRYDTIGRTYPDHDCDFDNRSLLQVGDSCSVLGFRGYPSVHSPGGSGSSGSGSCEACGGAGCKNRLAALEGLDREYRESKEREERAREREERAKERERRQREKERERGRWAAEEGRRRTMTRTQMRE